MNARHLATGALLTGIGALYACSDASTIVAPQAASQRAASPAVRDDGQHDGNLGRRVRVLRWNDRLSDDVVGTATIGPEGGVIALRDLNVIFSVPAGALAQRTTISVRALAGRRVVYQMSPEGLHFATPATLTMSLSNTNAYHKNAWRRLLTAGYIWSPIDIAPDDGVDSYEIMTTVVDDAVTVASFPVPHFSVVILASQFGDPGPICCAVVGNHDQN